MIGEVEAGIHAYAAKSGQYRSIRAGKCKARILSGTFEAPIVVHRWQVLRKLTRRRKSAYACSGLQALRSCREFCAAVGLVQNLGALKALTTVALLKVI